MTDLDVEAGEATTLERLAGEEEWRWCWVQWYFFSCRVREAGMAGFRGSRVLMAKNGSGRALQCWLMSREEGVCSKGAGFFL